MNSEGEASFVVNAVVTPPVVMFKYPSIDTGQSLDRQREKVDGFWYTDKYPSQIFSYVGSFAMRSDVLRIGVGPEGQPSTRSLAHADDTLLSDEYNWQGRKYTINQFVPLEGGVTATVGVYIPREWFTDAPGEPGCTGAPANCARAVDFALDLGLGNFGSSEHKFRAHIGFDNRNSSDKNYAYLYIDGPVIKNDGVPGVWPTSAVGSLLRFGFPGPDKRYTGWAAIVNAGGWNEFSFTMRRWSRDIAVVDGVSRSCSETAILEWYVVPES